MKGILPVFILSIFILSYQEVITNSSQSFIDFLPRKKVEPISIKDHQYYPVGNLLYRVAPSDTMISYPIKRGVSWEGFMHEYFKNHSDPTGNCLDIGANIGTHTLVLADYFSQVHAFEPQPDIFEILTSNVKVNKKRNVILHKHGLGDKSEVVSMDCMDSTKKKNPGGRGIARNGEGCLDISVKTLDSLNLKNISLIKLDVEGYEGKVLQGGMKTIQDQSPVVILEEHGWYNQPHSFKILKDLGYTIRRLTVVNDFIAIKGS